MADLCDCPESEALCRQADIKTVDVPRAGFDQFELFYWIEGNVVMRRDLSLT